MRAKAPRLLRFGSLGALALLVACGDRIGPLNERGVWRYGVRDADVREVTSAVGEARMPPPPSSTPAPAPAAPRPTATPPTRVEAAPAGAYAVVAVERGGEVRVSVRLRAAVTLPKVPVFKDHEKGCGHLHEKEMPSERLLFDPTTLGVGNCLVRIVAIDAGKDWPEAMRGDDRAFVVDQKGCSYMPHLAAVRTGTVVSIRNSDAADHNIHAYRNSFAETTFNLTSAPGSTVDSPDTVLDRVGTYILKCDIHPWMSGHVVAVTNPYFDVTHALDDPATGKKAGEAILTDVPSGEYQIEIWHEGTVETVNGTSSVTYSPAYSQFETVAVAPGATVRKDVVLEVR